MRINLKWICSSRQLCAWSWNVCAFLILHSTIENTMLDINQYSTFTLANINSLWVWILFKQKYPHSVIQKRSLSKIINFKKKRKKRWNNQLNNKTSSPWFGMCLLLLNFSFSNETFKSSWNGWINLFTSVLWIICRRIYFAQLLQSVSGVFKITLPI